MLTPSTAVSSDFFFLYLSDLNLKTQTKSAVSVREGQGVVLLCGTPSYAGGKAFIVLLICDSYIVAYVCSMGFNVF